MDTTVIRKKRDHKAYKKDRPWIYFMIGIPGSGKSSKAKELLEKKPNTLRINKDDQRAQMQGKDRTWNYDLETVFVAGVRAAGVEALRSGYNLVVDDTGFKDKHRSFWRQIAIDYDFNMMCIFLDVSLTTCKKRCQWAKENKGSHVGPEIAEDMYNKNLNTIKEFRKWKIHRANGSKTNNEPGTGRNGFLADL